MGERRLYGEAAVEMLRDLKRQEKNLPPFKVRVAATIGVSTTRSLVLIE